MKKNLSTAAGLALGLVIIGCGKGPVSLQSDQRQEIAPHLAGVWVSKCENNSTESISFKEGTLTTERVSYYDPECQDKVRTVRQSGKYELSNTYKSGIYDSIVFTTDNEVKITLHTDEVDNQNNVLTNIRNDKESTIRTTDTPQAKKNTMRENAKLNEAKSLTPWKQDQEKVLSRFQFEKLRNSLGQVPVYGLDTRNVIRYQLDNGFLLVSGNTDPYSNGNRVFAKLP